MLEPGCENQSRNESFANFERLLVGQIFGIISRGKENRDKWVSHGQKMRIEEKQKVCRYLLRINQ